MKIGRIGLDIPKIKRSAKRTSRRLDCALGYWDTFQLSRPQTPITPKIHQRELDEYEKDWIPKNPEEVSIVDDPLAIFIHRAQKEANHCLTDDEFLKIKQAYSIQGVLGVQEAKEAVGRAHDYLSIAHSSSRQMAARGLEMLKADPKLKPQELKRALLREGEKGAAKPAYRVAEYLDQLEKEIPGLTSKQAQKALSMAVSGKLNWYGWKKSLQIILGKVKED